MFAWTEKLILIISEVKYQAHIQLKRLCGTQDRKYITQNIDKILECLICVLQSCGGDHLAQMGRLENLIITVPAVCVADDVYFWERKIYI